MQGENFFKLREDMKIVGNYLQKVGDEVVKNEVSKYPIFLAHRESAIKLGKLILDKESTRTHWSYNVSLLEELVKEGFVAQEKTAEFRALYKSPKDFACFFVITPEDMNFVFCPYDMEAEWK